MNRFFIAMTAVISVSALVILVISSYYYLVQLPKQQARYQSLEKDLLDLKSNAEKNNNPSFQRRSDSDVYDKLDDLKSSVDDQNKLYE